MNGEQVVRVMRAVAKHLAAFADDLEQITGTPAPEPVGGLEPAATDTDWLRMGRA